MNIKVNNKSKKRFIKQLIDEYKFDVHEVEMIFTYLLTDDTLLAQTHFVNDITLCPRAISLSLLSKQSFCFVKGSIITNNSMQAYHDLRLNNDEQLFIKIEQIKRYDELYYAVLENNPFLTQYEFNRHLIKRKKRILQQQIDEALDVKDKEAFTYLTNELKMLIEYEIN